MQSSSGTQEKKQAKSLQKGTGWLGLLSYCNQATAYTDHTQGWSKHLEQKAITMGLLNANKRKNLRKDE